MAFSRIQSVRNNPITLLTDSYNCFRRMTREGSTPLTTLALIFIGD